MLTLISGLILFLGAHSTRIFAESFRKSFIDSKGKLAWMALIAIISIAGFVLIINGYQQTRMEAITLWSPPVWTKHIAALLTLVAFVFIACTYIPGTKIKETIAHPMLLGVKVWAFSHLLANGALGDILLFGSFLIWAILDFRAARRQDRANGTRYPAVSINRDAIAIVTAIATWILFSIYLHEILIGIKPFG